MNQVSVTQTHYDILEEFQYELEKDNFVVSLLVRDSIPEEFGEQFQSICLEICDNSINQSWLVLIDQKYNTFIQVSKQPGAPQLLAIYSIDIWRAIYLDVTSFLIQ